MKRSGLIIGAIILLVILLFGWWRSTYNSLVQTDETVKAQLGQLNNVYQQRNDLIPNLVATVQGAASAERETLKEVMNARAQATGVQLTPEVLNNPQAMRQFEQAQANLSGALSRLLVTVERYPDLKSQANFSTLMSQLEGQESRIRVERNRYNEAVQDYNRKVRSFPTSMIANMSGFQQYPYFQAAPGAENAPKVDFGNGSATTPSSSNGGTVTAPAGEAPPASAQPHGAVRPSH